MGQWSADGILIPTNLLECAAFHKGVRPICKCGHSKVFNPHGLWWHFERRGWNDRLPEVRKRFWCIICRSNHRRKVAPARIDLVQESDSDVCLPFPPDRVWRKQVRRMR